MCPTEQTPVSGHIAGPGDAVVERVAALLGAFTREDVGVPVAELARRADLARSTTYRLVDQLVEQGFLHRVGSRVHLGMRLFELGQLVPQQRNLRSLAMPFLLDLREATHQMTQLAVHDGRDLIYLERLTVPGAPPLPTGIGGRHPLHAGALGKAILSASTPEEIDEFCTGELPPVSAHTITDPEALLREIEAAKKTGLAYDHEEAFDAIYCVASPVLGRYRRVVGAISVTGLTRRVHIQRNSAAVRNAALNFSRSLQASAFGTTVRVRE